MRSDALERNLLAGGFAGLFGGLVYGVALLSLGYLPTIGRLVGRESVRIGFSIELTIAVVLGAGFGLLLFGQSAGYGEALIWGLAYGAVLWFVGPLTVQPLILTHHLGWDLASAQAAFPNLTGQLIYGVMTALVFAMLRGERQTATLGVALLTRGMIAGLLAGWLLGLLLQSQNRLLELAGLVSSHSTALAWLIVLALGGLAGLAFALLYPDASDGAGPSLIRGTVYGFLWWVLGSLTLLPLLTGHGLTWSIGAVQSDLATLPAYLLFGGGLALIYKWLASLVQLLFSETTSRRNREGVGTEGLRSLAWGAAAGLIGGLLFSVVMLRIGYLPTVARLVGSTSAGTGFTVELIISFLIGSSYGLLFRHQSFDLGSALCWGMSYGVFWWILGPLTLLPILLGTSPRWSVGVVASVFPRLIGHIAYGAGLGIAFYLLERRHRPWWVPHAEIRAVRATARREQLLTSSPALWTLMAVLTLTLPVLLARSSL